ncbi:exonuclease domain-containing protein [Streptococcus hyointestinalis]|uniref:exonuclease domain-containing protein n=1 Tax=Streptococcus hyointestinalis TaxID=1337 RepID=UPI001F157094|nr:exonuclease domain-containing protein [Streptococcus hyointestinalis]
MEATSAGSNAVITQDGIVNIENDEIEKTNSTDVIPHQALEDNFNQLTGSTDEQLRTALELSQVAREIIEQIEDCVIVAHNVK